VTTRRAVSFRAALRWMERKHPSAWLIYPARSAPSRVE